MLTVQLKGEILQKEEHQEGPITNRSNHYFDNLGIIAYVGDADVQLRVNVSNVADLQRYEITNVLVARYVKSYEFTFYLKDVERQTGRYKCRTASGRVSTNESGVVCVYLGSENLDDLRALAQKIEDGEIWPDKIPQKAHIPAYKFYRKTYGVPAILAIVGLLTAWLTYASMHGDTYLNHVAAHNTGCILMLQSLWGVALACLSGSRWVYLFSKDIKPVSRWVFGGIAFAGLLWFAGCLVCMTILSH